MTQTQKTSQVDTQSEYLEKNLDILLKDLLRGFGKLWWVTALLAVIFAGGFLIYGVRTQVPMYKASATFTVETYSTNGGYTFFYDSHTASQMARTFPFLLDSDLLLDRVKTDLGVEYLNGVASAEVIENSNLFTLSVTSRDPQDAYDILQALIRNYPAVAEYVIGRTQLNMIDYPAFPSLPYNRMQHLSSAALGALIGLALGMGIVFLYAITRNTVRREWDIDQKLHTCCLGSVPLVIPKRINKDKQLKLSIYSSKVGTPFKESFRGIALHVSRQLEEKKVLLVTATCTGEGSTTVAQNLAYALADQGKRVIYIDGNFQNTGDSGMLLEQYLLGQETLQQLLQKAADTQMCVLRCGRALSVRELSQISSPLAALIRTAKQQADYIIIDAPPCEHLDQIAHTAELAEGILYVIRQDSTKLSQIMNCFEDLNSYEARIIGCVLNGVRTDITGYGYGYSYGYGRGYGYGRYGHYGYGDEKPGKYTDREKAL